MKRLNVVLATLLVPGSLWAQIPAAGFSDEIVLSGLVDPTTVRFSSDGRIFIAEKSGRIMAFDGFDDLAPEEVIDLTAQVNSFMDRGLLGLALDPDFPRRPFLYALYTYDAPPGGTAPVWDDDCPTPPDGEVDGCVASGRLSRIEIGTAGGAVEQVLLDNNWCQQFSSHSLGDLAFGADGALYVSAGEGASFRPGSEAGVDYGQRGGSLEETPTPRNPCGDPPVPVGEAQIAPTAEGGALRSQDLRTPDDPVSFAGTILRLDPETGESLPDNPLVGNGNVEDDRIIAFGLRNPFRFTVHPQTGELWIGDVGWRRWEELDRIADPTDSLVENFGWPCYEGPHPQPEYDALDLDICEGLYREPGAVMPPYFSYAHDPPPDPDQCGVSNAAISGVAIYTGGRYPARYRGALVFADFSNRCIRAMLPGPDGDPDPGSLHTLVAQAPSPVDLRVGPGEDLFYVDLRGGALHRIRATLIFRDGFESGDLEAWSPGAASD